MLCRCNTQYSLTCSRFFPIPPIIFIVPKWPPSLLKTSRRPILPLLAAYIDSSRTSEPFSPKRTRQPSRDWTDSRNSLERAAKACKRIGVSSLHLIRLLESLAHLTQSQQPLLMQRLFCLLLLS